ncbi:hypothetical protein [Lacisediminihabitans sp. H27-G8]
MRFGSLAADIAQSIVAAFGGGGGDPARLQESAKLQYVRPQKPAVRRR